MTSRPRRSAATRANKVISVHARWADSPERSDPSNMASRRSGRTSGVSRDARSSPGEGDSEMSLTVKGPSNNLRQMTRGGRAFQGGEIVEGKRNRGKKNYVVDSSPEEDEEEDEEEEDEIEVGEEDDDEDDDMDEDAEGEEEMDVDAEGEEDAEGDIDMDHARPPTIKVSKPTRSRPAPRAAASKVVRDDEDEDDDDDDLSDPADSDAGDRTVGFGDETMNDEDAEGEEIEVAGQEGDEDDEEDEEEEEEEEAGPGSDVGSDGEELDLTKMTKRQRARFAEEPQQHMKLSDEVQAKKVFTAEELSMRRQEMARRRRNLSDKRNEEVKMETINKLLKKQAPKLNRKAAAGGEGGQGGGTGADPIFVRWTSNKKGSLVSVPDEMLQSPAGKVFGGGSGLSSGKMVEEVA